MIFMKIPKKPAIFGIQRRSSSRRFRSTSGRFTGFRALSTRFRYTKITVLQNLQLLLPEVRKIW